MSDESKDQQSGLSRRDALKRGAAVGGALWVAPLVTAAPAFGAEGSFGDSPPPCVNPLWVKFDDADYKVVNGEFVWGVVVDHVFVESDTPQLGSWAPTPAKPQDTCITAPEGTDVNWAVEPLPSGALVSGWSSTSVSETWTVTAKEAFGGKTYQFKATTTTGSITLEAYWLDGGTLKPVQIIDALWFQASECHPLDPASNVAWNAVTWEPGTPDDISHISVVICG